MKIMIRKITSPKLFGFIFVVLFSAFFANAQDGPPGEMPPPQAGQPHQQRPNLLRELGLSPEQIQQIRRLNAERRPLMEAAQRRLFETIRDLDIAIYSDGARDEEVQLRLKDFHAAQAEVARIRFMSELAVRRLLTPEQLIKFRGLRQRFAEARKNMVERRQDQKGLPGLRRLNPRQRPLLNE